MKHVCDSNETNSRAEGGVTTWESKLRAFVDEAFDLSGSPHLQAAVVEELIVAWDRHLRRHQQTLAVLRVLRQNNPQPNGGRRAA